MKKVLLLLGILLFLSCSRENKEPLCQNGGVFHNNRCHCPPGFMGDRCEIKDLCHEVKCNPRSQCVGGFCICLPTFYGANCDSNALNGKIYEAKNLVIIPGKEADFHKFVATGDLFSATVELDTVNNFFSEKHLTHLGRQEKIHLVLFSTGAFDGVVDKSGQGFLQRIRCLNITNGDSVHFSMLHFNLTDTASVFTDIGSFDLIKK